MNRIAGYVHEKSRFARYDDRGYVRCFVWFVYPWQDIPLFNGRADVDPRHPCEMVVDLTRLDPFPGVLSDGKELSAISPVRATRRLERTIFRWGRVDHYVYAEREDARPGRALALFALATNLLTFVVWTADGCP